MNAHSMCQINGAEVSRHRANEEIPLLSRLRPLYGAIHAQFHFSARIRGTRKVFARRSRQYPQIHIKRSGDWLSSDCPHSHLVLRLGGFLKAPGNSRIFRKLAAGYLTTATPCSPDKTVAWLRQPSCPASRECPLSFRSGHSLHGLPEMDR